jgi:hypothetical protein
MNLHYKSHPTNSMSAYVAPLANSENYMYACTFVRHFKPYSTGICSKEDLEEFKRFALLHNHNIIIED